MRAGWYVGNIKYNLHRNPLQRQAPLPSCSTNTQVHCIVDRSQSSEVSLDEVVVLDQCDSLLLSLDISWACSDWMHNVTELIYA